MYITNGELAPVATITNNQITGFAEGIHIGTSKKEPYQSFRSYAIKLHNNTIQLRATSLSSARHGIFIGNAHSVNVQDNIIQVVEPNPREWKKRLGQQQPPPPTDGIQLTGIYGPLLIVKSNHCIGTTKGVFITASRDARLRDGLAWSIQDNAYVGLGTAEVLSFTPSLSP